MSDFANLDFVMDRSHEPPTCPPLFPTDLLYLLQTSDGQYLKAEIFGSIETGFFKADNDWTCYRRNYFFIRCSYTLTPELPSESIYLVQDGGASPQVHSFSMSIAAVVDGKDGNSIGLVQHTPKRDKRPQDKPARITLAPQKPPQILSSHGVHVDGNSNPTGSIVEANFERLQFEHATSNNGKRGAAQQYYYLRS